MVSWSSSNIQTAVEAMKAGAEDFLDKPLSKNILLWKVKSILQEKTSPSDTCDGELLSHAEMRVLRLVAESKTSSEIARLLHRSYRTIQAHRASLLRKLNVKNSVALIRQAQVMGLIDTEPDRGEGKTIRKSKKKR
jgi:two-component system response regulator FixJ